MAATFTFSLTVHKGSLFRHPCRHLCLVSLITATLTGVRRYLTVLLLCISVMISDVEHLFKYLLPIYTSTLGKCLFRCSPYFLNWFFAIELFEFLIYFRYLTLIRYMTCKYLFPIQYVALSFC